MINLGPRRTLCLLVPATVFALLCRDGIAQVKIVKRIDLSRYKQPYAKMAPGDLDGDGRVDFLFTTGTRAARAVSHDGKLLWEIVDPSGIHNREPMHPWSAAVWDIDNDGANEAIIFRKRRDGQRPYLAIVNGRDGKIEKETELWFVPTTRNHLKRGLLAIAYPTDRNKPCIVVGSDDTLADVAAYDASLKQLWYRKFEMNGRRNEAGHYIWPYDLDGDGLHELFAGKRVFNGKGEELWWMRDFGQRDHVDSLACGDIDPGLPGPEVVACGASGAHLYDRGGKRLWSIPLKELRNPQSLVLGEFRKEVKGLEICFAERPSEKGCRSILFDCKGRQLDSEDPFGITAKMQIDWDGDRSQDELMLFEGLAGGVEDGQGRRLVNRRWFQ